MPGILSLLGGGGGKDKNGNAMPRSINPVMPAYMANRATTVIPSGQPGQIANMAKDMAMGGFGSRANDEAYLNNVYRPMVTSYPAAPSVVPTNPSTPVVPPISPAVPPVKPKPKTYGYGGGRNSR